ncbi:Rrf2 family transcriptional regulator [Patescibacteria group bacterium]|nr:Rrf2 family transcriptional regulator [Patescibacteria group bacterium]
MLEITKQSDYGLLLVSRLKEKKEYVPLSSILKEVKLPKRFIARIAALLVRAKILESREGKEGGYRLTKKAAEISLYEFFKIFEGDIAMTKCMMDGHRCPLGKNCPHQTFFKRVLKPSLELSLKKYKLLKVV